MASSSLTIKVAADVAKAVSGIEEVNKKLKELSDKSMTVSEKFKNVAALMGSATMAFNTVKSVVGALVNVNKQLIDSYSMQEQAQTRLATTLQATNNAIGMSASELYELASSFQDVSTYGDKAIMEVEKLFVASGKISKQALPKAIEATLDMASAMGDDLNSAAKRLAKTLADPKSNLDALKDANIQLSEAQKNEIKRLQEANNLYGAQSLILQSVANQYGGVAKAIADTDSGKLTQIENVWGDIKEGLGERLLDSISPALETLYDKLKSISDWIKEMNKEREIKETGKKINQGDWGGKKVADLSEEEIRATLDYNPYYGWLVQYRALQNSWPEGVESDFEGTRKRGIEFGAFTERDIATVEELEKRLKELTDARAKVNRDIGRISDSANSYEALAYEKSLLMGSLDSGTQGSVTIADRNAAEDKAAEEALIAQQETTKSAVEEYIAKNKSLSTTAQLLDIERQIAEAKEIQVSAEGDNAKIIDETIASLEGQRDKLLGIVNPKSDAELEAERLDKINSVISSNRGLSKTAQISNIDSQIAEAYSALSLTGGEGDTQYQSIVEIIEGLEKQKEALEEVSDASDDVAEAFETINDYAQTIGSSVVSLFSQVASLVDTIYENQISAMDSLIEESESRWDKYMDRLEDKQEMQKDSLAHLYDEGLISLEDYNKANQQMYDDKIAAQEEAEAEEEELQKRKNELEEKQFNANKANSITEAVISGALAVMDIWANHAGNPIMAGILTGLSAATTAAEIATISASQFTPMAVGGIVTKPTYALLGEGGAKEAVLPLTETNMKRSGLMASGSNGVINISINIGTVYSGEQLSKDVFNGIEKAQRTGLLPNWRYA